MEWSGAAIQAGTLVQIAGFGQLRPYGQNPHVLQLVTLEVESHKSESGVILTYAAVLPDGLDRHLF